MNKYEKSVKVEKIKSSVESAKGRLIEAECKLREIGAKREANTLSTIIGRLEAWQNK